MTIGSWAAPKITIGNRAAVFEAAPSLDAAASLLVEFLRLVATNTVDEAQLLAVEVGAAESFGEGPLDAVHICRCQIERTIRRHRKTRAACICPCLSARNATRARMVSSPTSKFQHAPTTRFQLPLPTKFEHAPTRRPMCPGATSLSLVISR